MRFKVGINHPKPHKRKTLSVIIGFLEEPSQHSLQDGIKDVCCSAPCNPQKHRPIEQGGQYVCYRYKESIVSL